MADAFGFSYFAMLNAGISIDYQRFETPRPSGPLEIEQQITP
jgi:hypothetical protein